jgi:hypothetical protein
MTLDERIDRMQKYIVERDASTDGELSNVVAMLQGLLFDAPTVSVRQLITDLSEESLEDGDKSLAQLEKFFGIAG